MNFLALILAGVTLVEGPQPTPAIPPTGSILLMHSDTVIGRTARRVLDGDQYTHAAIVIDGVVYEADWPAVQKHPAATYARPNTIMAVYVPRTPYSPAQSAAMLTYAENHLGQPYGLKTFFAPGTRDNGKTWCSRFVGDTLNASGRYRLCRQCVHSPHDVVRSVVADYLGPYAVLQP